MTTAIPVPTGLLTQLPTAGDLLDTDRLTARWGGPARVHYLRYKPGTSLVAALHTAQGPAWGICHVDPDKLHKLRVRADRHQARMVRLGPGAAAGSLVLDGVVGKGYRRLVRLAPKLLGTESVAMNVLRYNPSRRIVVGIQVAGAPVAVGRVGAPGRPLRADLLGQLHRSGLATEVLAQDPENGVLVLGWRTGTVRDRLSTATQRAAVADLLGRLARVVPRVSGLPRYDQQWWLRTLAESGSAVDGLDPGLGRRAAEVIAVLSTPEFGVPQLVHGDFSADQIVWAGEEPGLIDFDRAGFGPAWLDPASLLATECLEAGTAEPAAGHPAQIRRGAAHAVLRRATAPFRQVDPGWPAVVAARLDLASELAT